jgi:hypothetical protein
MKAYPLFSFALLSSILSISVDAQNNGNNQDVFLKANNAVNKVNNIIAVFQPYLLKARQIYYDAKQLANDARNSAKATFGKNNNGTDTSMMFNSNNGSNNNNSGFNNPNNNNSFNNNSNNNYQNNTQQNNNNQQFNNNYNNNYSNYSGPQNYLPNQSLPINNPSSINQDGSGNWGNQNNGLYGNCLDALTGTVMGMGEAQDNPGSVDLMFFAPADGQNTYYLLTPSFAHDNGTAGYMTEHTSEQVSSWKMVTESEVALTKLTIGQFDQIQNNSQISNAVRNAQNYSGYYASPERKLEGMVFAVKVQQENRTVYALIAVDNHFGTSGSSGYLKIRVKAQGIDTNGNGQLNANSYLR